MARTTFYDIVCKWLTKAIDKLAALLDGGTESAELCRVV
jgi:hypothetical protein